MNREHPKPETVGTSRITYQIFRPDLAEATVEDRNLVHDITRAEQLTNEALNPTTPAPGHAAGCVCHRCRVVADSKKTIHGGS